MAVTAFVNNEVEQRVQSAGFDLLLPMPVSFEQIESQIIPKLREREAKKAGLVPVRVQRGA